MKKFAKNLILMFTLLFMSFTISACKDKDDNTPPPLTDAEIIQEAKLTLKEEYNKVNIYKDLSLVGYIEVEDNKVYIDWSSSNNSLINATNGKVYRDLNNRTCTLSAVLTYKELSEVVDFIYTLPAKKYENSYPSFSSSKSEIQLSVAYLAYDDNNNLTIKLYIYNNLDSQKTLYGINNLTFSIATSKIIYNNSNYLVKDLVYTNSTQKQFTCKYGNYVTITLPIVSNNKLSYQSELATLSNPIVSMSGSFTYYHS